MKNDLTGLILAGGKSSRMGKDKALIEYNGKPQAIYLADLLSNYCKEVLISRNKEQEELPQCDYEIIYDDENIENQGPLTGLISAIKKYPDKTYFTVYCDLINVNNEVVEKLISAREENNFTTCFEISDFVEPSIVIIENKSNSILLQKYSEGNYSIIKFLKEFDTKKVLFEGQLKDKDE
jgi:molybdopterin-guanine dinucleotide biosynthesis protein A